MARERTLKILERLTARLALAEADRDMAMGELLALQKRYRDMEGELEKKRAELRELLRQEQANGSAAGAGARRTPSASATPDPSSAPPLPGSAGATATNPDSGMSGSQRSSVTLEILTESAEISRAVATRSAGSSLSAGAEASNTTESRLSSSLPKVDLKVNKVMQEELKEHLSSDRSSSVRSSLSDKVPHNHASSSSLPPVPPAAASSPASATSAPSPVVVPASLVVASHQRPGDFAQADRVDLRPSSSDYARMQQQQQPLQHQRHRSGTPTSVRSKVILLLLYYYET